LAQQRIGETQSDRLLEWCRIFVAASVLALLNGPLAGAQPSPELFDVHLHYNDEATSAYPVADVLQLVHASGVTALVATSRPNDGTRALVAAARESPVAPRVVPFIRPYRTHADRDTWFNDPEIYALIEAELARGIGYRGIGEFHVFGAADAGTAQVGKIVALAVARDLWLHAHCDEAALEALFAHDPRVKVIWAHSGFTTPPDALAGYLARHPTLIGELSFRYDVTQEGKVTPAWRRLFAAFPERFVIGSDTWVNQRWEQYGEIMAWYRGWLGQLPAGTARRIAFTNAAGLFKGAPGP
jgi:predicted TIM-barrel fold metal-dependent hydrolase